MTKLLWLIYNLDDSLMSNSLPKSIKSCVFKTQDGASWVLELILNLSEVFNAKLIVHAIPTQTDLKEGFKTRKILMEPFLFKNDCS